MNKPTLTKREVEAMLLYEHDTEKQLHRLLANTIEQAVELLRKPCHCWRGESTEKAIAAFLARYDGTNGKDGE